MQEGQLVRINGSGNVARIVSADAALLPIVLCELVESKSTLWIDVDALTLLDGTTVGVGGESGAEHAAEAADADPDLDEKTANFFRQNLAVRERSR